MNATTQWTKSALRAIRYWDMPRIRCQVGNRKCEGRIAEARGNAPWVEIWTGNGWRAEQFSFELVLNVLNDPREAPLYFWPTTPTE